MIYWFFFFYSYLISGDADGKVYVWDWKTTKLYNKFKAHDDVCIGVLWHPHETSKVATCGWDGVIKYWDWGHIWKGLGVGGVLVRVSWSEGEVMFGFVKCGTSIIPWKRMHCYQNNEQCKKMGGGVRWIGNQLISS